MHYHYAYLWDKGTSAPFNRYVVAIESVMTTNGQVFLAVLTESEEFAKCVISWFYEDALLILGEHGMDRQIKSTFLRNINGHWIKEEFQPEGTVLLMYGKKSFIFAKGKMKMLSADRKKQNCIFENTICFEKIKAGDAFLLYNDSFFEKMDQGTVLRKLGCVKESYCELDLAEEIQRNLQEIKRRIRSRGEKDSIAAIYILAERK